MNEDFLHYVWQFQKFHTEGLVTTSGDPLQILKTGQHNHNAGPDFLFAEVIIGPHRWAGMVEIHLNSSYWYGHGHETDANYDSVILHVVWEHDVEIYRSDGSSIPTLELKGRVQLNVLANYFGLIHSKHQWVPCEGQLASIPSLTMRSWLDRLYLERLDQKLRPIQKWLHQTRNDWDAVLFLLLCRNFGLKVNNTAFESIASSIPVTVLKKCRKRQQDLEALLMGQAGFLNSTSQDRYHQELQVRYRQLLAKFRITNDSITPPVFFRLRPSNFPTIRLAQLASLWHGDPHLFSGLMSAGSVEKLYSLLQASASEYWTDHYNFGVVSAARVKRLSRSFMDLLIINTVLPLKHVYAIERAREHSQEILTMAAGIKGEQNSIVKKFKSLYQFDNNALDSQALLQLKNNYCDRRRCMHCAIGNRLLKS
ncbi:MAG: DUF2851 family protein [Bacteroidota bacterium]